VSLTDDLDRIGEAAQALAAPGERVTGVLAAEPLGRPRVYLCAYDTGEGGHGWLALDHDAQPVVDLRAIRDAAQLAALCEVAADTAGGEELDELRLRLRELREREAPEGIEDAEAAAAALAAALADAPRVATTDFLDRIGALSRRLESTLGTDAASPFTTAMQQAVSAVEELAADIEANYKGVTQ
jgi:DNA-binding GntR family transcriptional regulator